MGSGVLDGFGFVTRAKEWIGLPKYDYIVGFAPVFLQRFTGMSLEIPSLASPPVGMPSLAGTYYIDGISSQGYEITIKSTLQYDLGSAVKDGWTFTEELKMGAFKMPKIPLSNSQEFKPNRWAKSEDVQKSNTKSWSQTITSIINLKLNYRASQVTKSVVYAKVYDKAAQIPFNGVVKVVFASGHVYSWNFTSAMSATDGSFAVAQIIDLVSSGAAAASAGAASAAAPGLRTVSDPEALAKELLALPDESPRKHKSLAMYTVKAGQTTWDAVCAAAGCDAGLAAALNGGAAPAAGAVVFVPTLG